MMPCLLHWISFLWWFFTERLSLRQDTRRGIIKVKEIWSHESNCHFGKRCSLQHLFLRRSGHSLQSTVFIRAVKEWDNGYLVVMAKYRHPPHPEEEYIGLLPILNGLYIKRPGVFEADQGCRDCKWLLLSRSPMMRMLSSYKYLHI